jgi:uncharacterized MnhB-related membrane protein
MTYMTEIFKIIMLVLLIVCAVSVNLTRGLLKAVIIFMSYSSIMCVLWVLMESPDLAITEAAVGAGVSGILFMATLKKIDAEKEDAREEESEDGRERT